MALFEYSVICKNCYLRYVYDEEKHNFVYILHSFTFTQTVISTLQKGKKFLKVS